ncbi:hypothetical protein B7755_052165 [Streptomyces sp. NBS 14/10]|uniref:hypothetical protein n=1 Tax=Streptomyces sp. NBS 14/10 TaxID=1945643 RepID=UPI000B7D9ABA|nr:hypothetical protein [Streptomyces sp. NBS 14/10]KAK1176705.1 hypothetical protein B7755_052165 [Streptomyces sp. NBS 14/10]
MLNGVRWRLRRHRAPARVVGGGLALPAETAAVCPVGWDELRIRAALLSMGVGMGGRPYDACEGRS